MKFYITVGSCPLCGKTLDNVEMAPDMGIIIWLSDGSEMPQPVCQEHRVNMQHLDIQREWLYRVKRLWKTEIKKSDQLSEEQKQTELKRITALEVIPCQPLKP